MSYLTRLWNDETGAVLSAEAVMVGTIGVVAVSAGLKMASSAVHDEMTEVAHAIRSLDQSYSFEGYQTERAFTASSSYRQRDVEESLKDLCGDEGDKTPTPVDEESSVDDKPSTGRLLTPTPPEDPSNEDAAPQVDPQPTAPSA
ncbi:MAG: hypothetical protein ACKVT0_04710 [Planctomycetaceae bacterium]